MSSGCGNERASKAFATQLTVRVTGAMTGLPVQSLPGLLAWIQDVFRTLATESRADRIHNPGLEEGRVDTIVGGCCALVAIYRTLGLEEVVVSEADILDGLALSLLA